MGFSGKHITLKNTGGHKHREDKDMGMDPRTAYERNEDDRDQINCIFFPELIKLIIFLEGFKRKDII